MKPLIYLYFRKRYDYASHARGLATNEWNEEEEDEYEDDLSDGMDYEEVYVKPPRSYKNQVECLFICSTLLSGCYFRLL